MSAKTEGNATLAEIAVHAAYRVGAIDIILSDDVQGVLPMPGIFRENLQGERDWRLRQLEEAGVSIAEYRVGKPKPKPRKRKPAAKPGARERSQR